MSSTHPERNCERNQTEPKNNGLKLEGQESESEEVLDRPLKRFKRTPDSDEQKGYELPIHVTVDNKELLLSELGSSENQEEAATGLDQSNSLSLLGLPSEILQKISSFLRNQDIKSLRLSCKPLHSLAKLRFDRVFLSTNPLDIAVFRTVAGDETLRHQIVEIIYDDARFHGTAKQFHFLKGSHSFDERKNWGEAMDLEWFERQFEENRTELRWKRRGDANCPQSEMSMEDCWVYYKDLFRQQEEVISTGSDIEALRYGLRRFTSLARVAISPAAHGINFKPLYGTPMLRSLPQGFIYPIPRGWPDNRDTLIEAEPWTEEHAAKWRGCRIVPRVLLEEREHHRVSELLIDSHQLETGLDCCVFQVENDEYRDIAAVIRQPGFKRLHLSLLVGGQEDESVDWASLNSGLLRKALSEAKDLERIDFGTDMRPDCLDRRGCFPPELQIMFPVESWTRLQHFGLSNYMVEPHDLVKLLSLLPQTLRSVELNGLTFVDEDDNYHGLLSEMRDKLDWKEWSVQPVVRIATPTWNDEPIWVAIWLEREIGDFLYEEGENPFDEDVVQGEPWVRGGFGVVLDAFDPDYEWAWPDRDGC